jgi:excisionase family DNA binding protein
MKQRTRPQRRARQAGRPTADVVTVEDLARRLGIGRNQAYEAVASGKISGVFRIGRRWLIPRLALERLLSGETHMA